MSDPTDTLDVTYTLTVHPDEDAADKARGVALEQSVELPFACVPAAQHDRIPEQRLLEHCETDRDGAQVWRLTLAFPLQLIDGDPLQLLNVLFGNISLKRGIRVLDIRWPQALLDALRGPRFGLDGVRQRLGVHDRALTCTALKPIGRSPDELAADAAAFARGGIDLIKDDHGLLDQRSAPFTERLRRCQDAVREHAGPAPSRYLPNVTAPRGELERRVEMAVDAGCDTVLLSPFLTGLDAIGFLRDRFPVSIMAHPAFGGAVAEQAHGFAPDLLLGEVLRILGADAVIYPNAGGRFPTYDQPLCDRIVDRLRRPVPGDDAQRIAPAWPTPGGGVEAHRVPEWIARYGADTILLIGGSLYAQGDLTAAAERFRAAVETPAAPVG